MESQTNSQDQNTQHADQSPLVQPVVSPEKPKINYLMIGGIVLVCFLVFGLGGYYLGRQSSSQQAVDYSQRSPNPTAPTAYDTINWITYTDATFNVSVKYPDGWNYQGLAPNLILFKPKNYEIPEGVEAQVQGVYFRMLHFNYEDSLARLRNVYDGEIHEEDISANGLLGKHIWGTIGTGQAQGLSGGTFVLKNTDGNAFEFEYEVTSDRSFEKEARLMMLSIERKI